MGEILQIRGQTRDFSDTMQLGFDLLPEEVLVTNVFVGEAIKCIRRNPEVAAEIILAASWLLSDDPSALRNLVSEAGSTIDQLNSVLHS